MRHHILHILCLIEILLPAALGAQNLPTLGKAPEITVGKLPNGLDYYITSNAAVTGYADFALAQKGVRDVDTSRGALNSLPHFGDCAPYRFLARNAVGYSEQGFVTFPAAGTVFRFEKVPVFNQSVCDSTLLMIFDLALTSPQTQAIMISGDVNTGKIVERMQALSMTVNRRIPAPEADDYIWNPRATIDYRFIQSRSRDCATIKIAYRAPRTEKALLNTPQPLVTEMFAKELGSILHERVAHLFRESDVPLGSYDSKYMSATAGEGDERFEITVTTAPGCVQTAAALLARVLSTLDREGAQMQELRDAKTRVTADLLRQGSSQKPTNRRYIDKCLASYLLGASLAPDSEITAFFAKRKLADDRELELFNRFTAAMVHRSRNLVMTCILPAPMADPRIDLIFDDEWFSSDRVAAFAAADTLRLSEPSPKSKVKIKATAPEPVTGGQMWTFSNGMKVVFKKKTDVKGEFNYALMLRTGYDSVAGLGDGEGAFVADMFNLCRVSGVSGPSFRGMLRDNGMTMKASASLSDFRIGGVAPSNKLQLLLKSILSLARTRENDNDAFEYYRKTEDLRQRSRALSGQGVFDKMDSLICPEYRYSPVKYIGNLGNDLPARTKAYFDKLFTNMDGGLLVFVGDLDENELKKTLCRFLGDFKTGNARSIRPRITFPMHSGWSTYTETASLAGVGDGTPSVNVEISALTPFNIDSYMAFRLAVMAVQNALTRSLANKGMYAAVTPKIDIFPAERLTVYIVCKSCPREGLPAGVEPAGPLDALSEVRKALAHLSESNLSDAELKVGKSALTNEMNATMGTGAALVDAVLMRYSDGKDLASGYKDHIASVTREQVKAMLRELDRGTRIEYVLL